jgi:hypothetical protein
MSRILRTLLLLGGIAAALPATAEPLVVIVDRDNPASDISLDELKSYFTGKRKDWPDGARVIPIDLEAGAPERKVFGKTALGMSADEYERWWVDQRVRGQGSAPRAVSAASALKLAARARGVLAYVRASQADASVKVLKVNGVAPGAAGYPLDVP